MIKYSLGCENSHEFEGWFSSSEEFDRLKESGHLDCPSCGSNAIEKLLMAPSVKTTKGKEIVVPAIGNSEAQYSPAIPAPAQVLQNPNAAAASKPGLPLSAQNAVPAPIEGAVMPQIPEDVKAEIVEKMRDIKKQVLASAEDVGENFGEEARKIHYGEAEKRGIYGRTSQEEAIDLLEEGVDIIPLPVLPEDNN